MTRPHWLPASQAHSTHTISRRLRRAFLSRQYYRCGWYWGVLCGALWGLFVGVACTAAALRLGMSWGV